MQVSVYGLDKDEVYRMMRGNYKFKKCPSCDNNGLQWYDGSTGLVASSSPSGIYPEWVTYEGCSECNGYGYFLIFED